MVRHGETEWNKLHRIQGGASNIPLNETGRQQAEYLALRLRSESIQAIYSSPLSRSLDTAQAIAQYHQLEVLLEPDLLEFNLGELDGKRQNEVGKSFHEIVITSSQGEIFPRVPGGESLKEVQQRAWSTILRLVSCHPEGVLVVVSHLLTISTIIYSGLNLPLLETGRLRLDPASISILAFDEQIPRLLLLNDTCHLKNQLKNNK